MTIYRNRTESTARSTRPATPAPLNFHQRLPTYRPTPLIDIADVGRLTSFPLGQILIKDESSRLGLPSFKILGASWATYRALSERLGSEPAPWQTLDELADRFRGLASITLATATDGNHGRAVARMASLLGLKARILVPAGTVDSRIRAIESEGAEVEVVNGTYDDAVSRMTTMADDDCLVVSDSLPADCGQVPDWIIEGYSTIFWEIEHTLAVRGWDQPQIVFVPVGVGALAAAVVRHYAGTPADRRPLIVGVEPDSAACVQASVRAGFVTMLPGPHRSIMAGLNCGTPSFAAWPDISGGIDVLVSITDDRARVAMRRLADAGLVAGETGAAALGGLLEIATRHPGLLTRGGGGARVLILLTEGATDPQGYETAVGLPAGEVACRTAVDGACERNRNTG